jgi:hypothetical protein
MRYTIDLNADGYVMYRGGPITKPRKSERILTSNGCDGAQLEALFNVLREECRNTKQQVRQEPDASNPQVR